MSHGRFTNRPDIFECLYTKCLMQQPYFYSFLKLSGETPVSRLNTILK